MRKFIIIIFYSAFSLVCLAMSVYAYDPGAPLRVKKVEFSVNKPKGLGIFELRDNNTFKKEEPVYVYVELSNCKPEKKSRFYHIRLTMDVDIYYEDGICVYSEDDANVVDRESLVKNTDSYLWTKIETSFLKEGEYKVEMSIKDENSTKETFALTRFMILDRD